MRFSRNRPSFWFISVTLVAATVVLRWTHLSGVNENQVLARSRALVHAILDAESEVTLVALKCRDLSPGQNGPIWLVHGDEGSGRHSFRFLWCQDGESFQEIGHHRRGHVLGRAMSPEGGAVRAVFWLRRLGLVDSSAAAPRLGLAGIARDSLSYLATLEKVVVRITVHRCSGDLTLCRIESLDPQRNRRIPTR